MYLVTIKKWKYIMNIALAAANLEKYRESMWN